MHWLNWNIKITNSFKCLPSLLYIMFLCLMEVHIFAKNNTYIFKISAYVNFMNTYIYREIKIKTLVLSSTKDHNFSLIKVNTM